jgi:putative Mg2+ transporter-C (MgtC) family protein
MDSLNASLNHYFASLGTPLEAIVRLLLAALFGALVGFEREVRGRQAGFRTNLLVCVGSALVMLVSIEFARHPWPANPGVNINLDPARIAYGVMTGIGFLCAGVIVKGDGGVRGLTTAAGLWCVAAIGIALGFGMYLISILATMIVLAALWMLDHLENYLPKTHHRKIIVRCPYVPDCSSEVARQIETTGVRVIATSFQRSADLETADVEARIAFRRHFDFHQMEKTLQSAAQFNLISSQEY